MITPDIEFLRSLLASGNCTSTQCHTLHFLLQCLLRWPQAHLVPEYFGMELWDELRKIMLIINLELLSAWGQVTTDKLAHEQQRLHGFLIGPLPASFWIYFPLSLLIDKVQLIHLIPLLFKK